MGSFSIASDFMLVHGAAATEPHDEEPDKLEPTICLTCPCNKGGGNVTTARLAKACTACRCPCLMNVNAWSKAASLVDARIVDGGDRILTIVTSHNRAWLPASVWTRTADATLRMQTRECHHACRCQVVADTKVRRNSCCIAGTVNAVCVWLSSAPLQKEPERKST